jgi:cytosine/adenosine deaminase-related metal-dependent hydrolase
LVNAHTHLEFSLLEAPLGDPSQGFCQWIRDVVGYRRQRGAASAAAIAAGLEECRRAQVAVLGEIASEPWPLELDAVIKGGEPLPCGVVFRELLGLTPDRSQGLIDAASVHLFSPCIGAFRPGLSPHAPYTISPEMVRRAAELTVRVEAPLAMHLAETTEELELLASHSGPMLAMLEDLDAWHSGALPRGIRPLDYLRILSAAHRALVIHGNYLNSEEIKFLGANSDRMSVVYCPRTHAFFRHQNYPLAQMIEAGANVALGTDSRASNPDLNLWSEAQVAAKAHPNVSPAEILRMATANGAIALGWDREFGTLEPDKWAALCIVPLAAQSADDPHELLFAL